MKKLLLMLLSAALLLGIVSLASSPAMAQRTTRGSVKAKSGESDYQSKLKVTKENAQEQEGKVKAPPSKGGKRVRGKAAGVIDFDNHTAWNVDCYVDGVFQGTVGPYGNLRIYAPGGSYRLYGKRSYGDEYFGPKDIYLGSSFTWSLYP